MVAYENSSDEFEIGHCLIKVKVTARLRNFSPFTTLKSVKSSISALALDRKMKYVWLSVLIYTIYKYWQA